MASLNPSEKSFGFAYSMQVKQIVSQPSPWVVGFSFFVFCCSSKYITLPPIFPVFLSQIITTLVFNAIFHFHVDFFMGYFFRILPLFFWVYQLSADSMDSSISPTSSISSFFLI